MAPQLFDDEPAPKRPRCRPGWTRTHYDTRSKKFGTWRHDATGWTVSHCGHATANWPYYGLPPDAPDGAELFLTGGFGLGHAFPTLAEAMEAIENHIRKQAAHDRA